MNDTFYINIDDLGLSQIYLNRDKVKNILSWFDPLTINEYEPLPVYDFFGNGKYILTDGHTRAYLSYKCGLTTIPVKIDNDETVTCKLGRILYKEYIGWCNQFNLKSIKDLEYRIIPPDDYEFLWIKRCERLYNLVNAMEDKLITLKDYEDLKKIGESKKLELYGANENLTNFFYEDLAGNLSTYSDKQIIKE